MDDAPALDPDFNDEDLVIERVAYDAIRPHPRNPRIGDVDVIVTSLKAHGLYVALTVQRSTGFILRGNHTWQALGRLGARTVQVVYRDVNDREALEILLMDNRASDRARYREIELADILTELSTDLTPTGWTRDELADLLTGLTPTSLDDLADELGDHDPEAVWPHVRLQVSPVTKARFEQWWSTLDGDTDEAKALGHLAALVP